MTVSTYHLFILLEARIHPIPYSSIKEKNIPDYDYLVNKGYLEYSGSIESYDVPNVVGYYINPENVVLTMDGKIALSAYFREQVAVWLGILIDFVLAVIGIIVGLK